MKALFIILFSCLFLCSCDPEYTEQDISPKTRDSVLLKVNEYVGKHVYEKADSVLGLFQWRPDDKELMTKRIQIKYKLGKYSEALALLNVSETYESGNPELFYMKGSCYAALELNDSALNQIHKAIAINGVEKKYWRFRIDLYRKLKDTISESFDIHQFIALDTNDLTAACLLGQLKFRKGDTLGSLSEYKKVEAKDPSFTSALSSIGFIYLMQKQTKNAETYFNKVLVNDPQNAEVLYALASLLATKKPMDKACDCLLKAFEAGSKEAGMSLYKCSEYFSKKGIKIENSIDPEVETKTQPKVTEM